MTDKYPNPSNIQIGNVVRVKSGSRRMCVVCVDDSGKASCEYSMSGVGVGIKTKAFTARFHVSTLRKCLMGFL